MPTPDEIKALELAYSGSFGAYAFGDESSRTTMNNIDRDARTQIASAGGLPGVNPYWQERLRFLADNPQSNRGNVANNWSFVNRDNRAAQYSLLEQMRAQQAGPSIANMQGQGAMGQNLQAALQARGPNAGVASRAGSAGAGLGADVARARLAEQMQSSAQQGTVAGNMRESSLADASNSARAAMQARGLEDANTQAYARMGSGMQRTMSRAELENLKVLARLYQNRVKRGNDGARMALGVFGTGLSNFATGG